MVICFFTERNEIGSNVDNVIETNEENNFIHTSSAEHRNLAPPEMENLPGGDLFIFTNDDIILDLYIL